MLWDGWTDGSLCLIDWPALYKLYPHSLAQEATLEEMVTYLVEAAAPGADDKRVHKYPYMACEVSSCSCLCALGRR